ncbi:MAG: HDOD domain-containing protein, partial [Thermoleophilaceae bacterium]|nr:HDOD domain-containing protein [Thermoleophilaceae bacterium]
MTSPVKPDVVRRHDEGHGRRLTVAFEALEAFPALAESRDRVLRVVREDRTSVGEVVAAVESDVALVVTVLRIANRAVQRKRGKIASIPEAVEVLSPDGVEAIAARAMTFDFFERTPGWDLMPERFRLHAVATQSAADRLARELDFPDRDELLCTALLHDIGKLVLSHAYPGYPQQIHGEARTPEERLRSERLELGVDHALVGGVLARRWGMPNRLALTIERHHSDDAEGEAALIRLADMLARYGHAQPVSPNQLLRAAQAVGLSTAQLRAVMYELPHGGNAVKRNVDPCPLSAREVEVLKRLGEGKVYKQIAHELELSTSTVRTHLHNTYAKLG